MEKTKKNGILKTAACIFGGTMLMTCVLGGTLAKYSSSQELGTLTNATAASWDIDVNDGELDSLSSGLKFTITSNGAQAKNAAYTEKPAPGSYGYAEVKIVNNGDVDAKVKLNSTEVKEYEQTGLTLGLTETKPDGTKGVENDFSSDGVVVQAGDTAGKTVYIAYNWAWDNDGQGGTDNDAGDTKLAGQSLDFGTITLTAEQAKLGG